MWMRRSWRGANCGRKRDSAPPGFCRQPQHIFIATGLSHGETDFDPEEHDLTLHRVPVAEFESMLLDNRIKDTCTLAAWGLYKLWKESQREQTLQGVRDGR
jgi:hypothetical protein